MAPTALLVVSNIKQFGQTLSAKELRGLTSLYIHLNIPTPAVGQGQVPSLVTPPSPSWGRAIRELYQQETCNHIDMRVLIGPLKNRTTNNALNIQLPKPIDVIYADTQMSELCETLRQQFNVSKKSVVLSKDNSDRANDIEEYVDKKGKTEMFETVVLGGTFDRIHPGHKIFLSEAVLRASGRLVVGVTMDHMNKSKTLPELMLPVEQRIEDVKDFLMDIDPNLKYEVVPISDGYGPTQTDPNMDLLVVSEETMSGGNKVNDMRATKNLKKLEIFCVDLVRDDEPSDGPREHKVSSSNRRLDLLGTRWRPPPARPNLPPRPYIVGLTGGIASGKSNFVKYFSYPEVLVLDCDKIAHEIYLPGTQVYVKLIQHFGSVILRDDGNIDRIKLGGIVFCDPQQLTALNGIVWPELICEVKRRIKADANQHDIIMIEAAILFRAGWDTECHEVWGIIVPPEEAVRRVMERNGLNEAAARKRLESQMTNNEIVNRSNVIFSSQWDTSFTQIQAARAWRLLTTLIAKRSTL